MQPHPPTAQLQAFALGRLPDAELQDIATHVAECQDCCRLLHNVPNDELVGIVRDARALLEPLSDPAAKAKAPSSLGSHQPLPQQFDDYEILRVLGHGGMGVVYEAVQKSLGRHVALKVLPHHVVQDPDHVERFRRESRAAAQLHHSNIVPVFGVGEENGVHYYVMQYIHGEPLNQVLQQARQAQATSDSTSRTGLVAQSLFTGFDGSSQLDSVSSKSKGSSRGQQMHPAGSLTSSPFPASRGAQYFHSAAQIGIQVGEALHYAHQQGIMHRDIKPSNLLLDSHGTVWITDFGLAKDTSEDDLTKTGDLVGTLRYMAPERFHGTADPRSDVYSLGLTLYEMITLTPAFADSNRLRLMERIRDSQFSAPRQLNPRIPRDFETIVLKAISREPHQRYATAALLADDLKRFLAEEPIHARPITLWRQTLKWIKRRPAIAALLACIFLVAFAGFGAVLFQWHRAEEALADAQTAYHAKTQEQDKTAKTLQEAKANLYLHSIALADSAWKSNQVTRARELLLNCPVDLRHWEWHYLMRRTHNFDQSLHAASPAPFVRCAWSENDLFVIAIDAQDIVTVWDTQRNLIVRTFRVSPPETKHKDNPLLSPLSKQKPALTRLKTHTAFSQHGQRIACVQEDYSVKVWDTSNGALIFHSKSFPAAVQSIVLNRTGSRLAVCPVRGPVQVLDVDTGDLAGTLGGVDAYMKLLAFAPDDQHIVADAKSHQLLINTGFSIYSIKTGTKVASITCPVISMLANASFSPDGGRFALACGNTSVAIWKCSQDHKHYSQELVVSHLSGPISGLAFSPDGKVLATSSLDRSVKLWRLPEGQELFTLRGHTEWPSDVTFSADSKRLLSAGLDHSVKIWQARSQDHEITTIAPARESFVRSGHGAIYSSSGKWVALAGTKGSVLLRSLASSKEMLCAREMDAACSQVVFSADDRLVAAGYRDGSIIVWQVDTAQPQQSMAGNGKNVTALAFSADGRLLVTGREDKRLSVWDVQSGKRLDSFRALATSIRSVAVSANGNLVTALSQTNEVTVWEIDKSEPIHHFNQVTDSITCVVFNPGSKCLALAAGTSVYLLNGNSGEVTAKLKGHNEEISGLAFTPDGKRMATVAKDGYLKIWDVASLRDCLTLQVDLHLLYQLAFTSDGHLQTTNPNGMTVCRWNGEAWQ